MADDVVRAASRHRAALAAGQRKATEQLAVAYAQVWQATRADWVALTRRIDDARAAGEVVDVAWLEREARYRSLILRMQNGIAALGPVVESIAAPLVAEALAAAAVNAAELTALALHTPSLSAIAITGSTTRGPVAQLIAARAGAHAEAAAAVIREGVVRGLAPQVTARRLRAVTGGAFTNGATVVRTEQMRAYREGARQSYAANPEVHRWRWLSRRSERTCVFCWAMDGREFSADRVMPTHPNCGCTMLPVVPSVDYGDAGPAVFDTLPEETKRRVLSPVAFDAYQRGELALPDLVSLGRHPTWGPVGGRKSLADVLGADRVAEIQRALRL